MIITTLCFYTLFACLVHVMIMNYNKTISINFESHLSYKLPVPVNISNLWNFGRCLGLFLILQIITGLLLASHYTADTSLAFDRIVSISRDVSWGAILRIIHLNGASMYFVFLYIHIGRGLYYGSYSYTITYFTGFLILIFSMVVAFLGYVLPWGQIRYWGATVITNLISAIPVIGPDIVRWVWGGYGISNATLARFFIIHFCIPIVIIGFVGVHVYSLHKTGSQNPSNILRKYNILTFHPFFVIKDVIFFLIVFTIFEVLVFLNPYLLGDPENFSIANMISTPEHIVPEWYFLFAYAILRCIPRKGLGVLRILLSVFVILIPRLIFLRKKLPLRKRKRFSYVIQVLMWMFFTMIILLTWLGAQTVRGSFVKISQILFALYLMNCLIITVRV